MYTKITDIKTIEELEELTDKVNRGISVDIYDALCVIEYQQHLERQRPVGMESTAYGKIKLFFKKLFLGKEARL